MMFKRSSINERMWMIVEMDDYLSKPFNLEDLWTVMKRWLPSESCPES